MNVKKGNYGLDAPAVVLGYLAAGTIFLIIGMVLKDGGSIGFSILLLLIGCYMVYSSKCGKYKMREKILGYLSIRGSDTVLDVGCGRGLMLNGVAAKLTTGKAYGIDLWKGQDQSGNCKEAVLKNAKLEGTADKIDVQSADMRKLPFPDETFSVIVSSLAIHNVKPEEERKKALLEIARVAKNGCRVAIMDIGLSHIEEYIAVLAQNGFMVEKLLRNQHQIFPPVSVVIARKQKIALHTSEK